MVRALVSLAEIPVSRSYSLDHNVLEGIQLQFQEIKSPLVTSIGTAICDSVMHVCKILLLKLNYRAGELAQQLNIYCQAC